jgi:hypothetical protein
VREGDIQPPDRFNDPLLLLSREIETGACHKGYQVFLQCTSRVKNIKYLIKRFIIYLLLNCSCSPVLDRRRGLPTSNLLISAHVG